MKELHRNMPSHPLIKTNKEIFNQMTAFSGAQWNWCCVSPGQKRASRAPLHGGRHEVIVTVLTHLWMLKLGQTWSDSHRVNTLLDAEAWAAVAREREHSTGTN